MSLYIYIHTYVYIYIYIVCYIYIYIYVYTLSSHALTCALPIHATPFYASVRRGSIPSEQAEARTEHARSGHPGHPWGGVHINIYIYIYIHTYIHT